MKLARSLERRLERLLEGMFSRVFTGRLHASEVAGRIAREADLARFEHQTGPATANQYTLTFNPADIDGDGSDLADSLARSLAEYAAEAGLRLMGPPRMIIRTDDKILPGQFTCSPEVVPGTEPAWARLIGDPGTVEVRANRSLVGRGEDTDITIPVAEVSRHQALLWRSEGSVWIRDLGSANGTYVDGQRVGGSPVEVGTGTVIQFGPVRYRLVKASDA